MGCLSCPEMLEPASVLHHAELSQGTTRSKRTLEARGS